MGERLIKPYEISVWEDKLIQDGATYRFEENKLAVIGSDTMTGLNKVYDPVFNKKTNGEKTLTFSLKYKYFDPYSGNSDFVNPFAALLVNERKVKLHYDNQWYEFIIKDHTESSDELTWTYTCTDAFVLELSKNGYNLTFDSELNNNQGTATELAEKVLKDTDWQLGDSEDVFKQFIAEPIYKATLLFTTGIEIINASDNNENAEQPPNPTADIYVFYNYVKNKSGKFVQFIIRNDNRNYTIDSNNVITDTNFRILTELVYDETTSKFKTINGIDIISLGEIENRYQANRLVYNQLTTYDSVMERTVDRFQIEGEDTEVYKYTDYEYTTSNVVMNYITNGENFNILEDGTLQGWNPYTDQSNNESVNKLELVTYPELATGKPLANLNTLSQVEGFLKVTFNGALEKSNGQYYNTVYNSGIENNASFIHSISKGDKFVFRWRAGKGGLGQLQPVETLGLIIAQYDQDAPTWGYYYKHIKEEDVIAHFVGRARGSDLPVVNNIIEGGSIVTETLEDQTIIQNYVIDGVVQTPSTKYIYKSNNNSYVWNGLKGKFDPLTNNNYLPYYYLVAEAKQSVPNTILSDPKTRIGIFVYTTNVETTTTIDPDTEESITTINPIYIQDIQLTRFVQDAAYNDEHPILIGNVPTATAQATDYYYLKPLDGTAAEDVETYTLLDKLASRLGINERLIKPKYNENSEKTLSISASQSNCFNILQTIAETFECWVDLEVEHDDQGYITYGYVLTSDTKINEHKIYYTRSGNSPYTYTSVQTPDVEQIATYYEYKPNKYVYLREYVGKDNYAGFKYGINLQSIERNINSDEIVTKLIVDQSQSDYVDEGFVSIALAPSNTSGESYILNFDYYYNQGLLNREEVEADKNRFIINVAELNRQIQEKEKERINLEAALTALESNRNVYTELVNTAEDTLTQTLEEFERLTGLTYEEYRVEHGELIEEEAERVEEFISEDAEALENIFELSLIPEKNSEIQIVCEDFNWDISFVADTASIYEGEDDFTLSYDGETNFIFSNKALGASVITISYIAATDQLTDEETIVDVLGTLYSCSSTINNYGGLLTNIEKEYWEVRHQLRGSEDYSVRFWRAQDDNQQYHMFVDFNDYLVGAGFTVGQNEYSVTISRKFFDLTTNETNITFVLPQDYEIESAQYTYTVDTVKTVVIKSTGNDPSIKKGIENLQTQKDTLTNNFNNKYRRFIQEGTWNSTDYIDSELYFLDAVQVSNTSSQPQVSYTINVVEVSELEGLELYKFDAGDKTYVEDTDYFGWSNVDGILTPAREEVIVSEVEWYLDEPENNVITVQNYKTRFEDLFQRISATVQTVQYNEATYAKISTLLDANGTINANILLNSLNNISGQKYTLTTDGSVLINGNEILVRNLTNPANRVIINNEGISVSADGGNSWKKVIDGFGINADAVTSGEINTNNVIIGDKTNPSFRWDKSGISAYKSGQDGIYDLQTYVRYDEYGLYGIKNDTFKAESLQDVLDKAHFAVTWDGFFIKNSYTGGGRVEITSDNDFRVLNQVNNQEQEKVKIGALEWTQNGITTEAPIPGVAPSLYGIRIKNNAGQTVMKTGDDGNLEITGTINALGGNFNDLITVGRNKNYKAVDDPSGSPQSHNWYELINGEYQLTNDTTVNPNKTYYEELPYIAIDGRTAEIYSSNYQDGAGRGWLINKNGDAVFNNITARGAIKTAVFEYAEIQAVGGIFIFRPSSTIRSATVNGNDLILTVEKPMLFKVGQWCKISNYISNGEANNPDIDDILSTNGLTHVYQISAINSANGVTLITLQGAKRLLNSINKDANSLVGGALIDFGYKQNTFAPFTPLEGSNPQDLGLYIYDNNQQTYVLTTDNEVISGTTYYRELYQNGIHNYGIGVNSSDNTVNLPARAISLFETTIDETHEPKVTYNYRGILGTLPIMSRDASQVNNLYHNYLQGTQGIYTNNLYIGDDKQYIVFYTDKRDGKKHLRISAKEFVFESDNGTEKSWQEYIEEEISSIDISEATEALDIATGINQHFWTLTEDYAVGIPAGSYITDTVINEFKQNKTGGNLLTRADGIWIRNGTNTLVSLTGSALTFYEPGTKNADAVLDAHGLVLTKGGIKAGEYQPNYTDRRQNFVYLSSEDYTTDEANGIIINDSDIKTDWRLIIGNKFGVDKAGNLYAHNATISGHIVATTGVFGGAAINDDTGLLEIDQSLVNGLTGDLTEIRQEASIKGYTLAVDTDYSAEQVVTLTAHLYYGETEVTERFPESIFYWYAKNEDSFGGTYTAITDPTGNPKDHGWYEFVDNEYIPTADIVVIIGKTYFARTNPTNPIIPLGNAYSITFNRDDAGYGTTIVCNFAIDEEILLTTPDNYAVATPDDYALTARV